LDKYNKKFSYRRQIQRPPSMESNQSISSWLRRQAIYLQYNTIFV